jgi:hypothetical protein
MPGPATTTAIALGAIGIASATALDVAIDRSGHDHDSAAYRWGGVPTRVLAFGGGGVLAAGLGARLVPSLAGASPMLLRVGAGAIGAWAATFAVRIGVGMLFDPTGTGMRFRPGDIAKNSVDRTHMMGVTSRPHERAALGWISEQQGHGSFDERLARGDFVAVWQPGDQPPGFAAAEAEAAASAAAGSMSRS